MECLLCSSSFLQLRAVLLPLPWARVVSLLADGVRALHLFTTSVPSAALPQNVPKRPRFRCGGSFPLLVLSKTNIGLLSKQQLIREHMFPRSLTAGKQGQIEKPVGNPQPRCFQSACCSLQCVWGALVRALTSHPSQQTHLSGAPESGTSPTSSLTSKNLRFSSVFSSLQWECLYLRFPCILVSLRGNNGIPCFSE